jgi:hypothetical protein
MSTKRKPSRVASKSYPFGLSLYLVEFTTPSGTPSVTHAAGKDELSALTTLRSVRVVERVNRVTFIGYVLVPANPRG